jgi:hypothetical protein
MEHHLFRITNELNRIVVCFRYVSPAFLDFFETRLTPNSANLLSPERLSHFAPVVRLFVHVPQNVRAHDCVLHKQPLGRLLEHELMCDKFATASLVTETFVYWFRQVASQPGEDRTECEGNRRRTFTTPTW